MIKEYQNQIKNLKFFFDEKINEKNIKNFSENKNKQFFSEEKINKETLLTKSTKSKFNINAKKHFQENKIFNDTNVLNNVNLNGYNFDIGPKLNIIDFNELLNKIHRQRVKIKNNNNNNNDNFLMKFVELNKKKIKFENLLIKEKTKILNNNKQNIFINKNNKYNSRNIYNRNQNRKNYYIRNRLFNENKIKIKKDNILNSSRKITLENSLTDKTFSSFNEIDFLKIINEKEVKKEKTREKINIEKIGLKKDFGITKVGFNKTINKIRKINNNKINTIKKKMKVYNFSFLNTIYGKINTQRKMKINEIDYKEEIKQKGFQLLFKAFKQNPIIELNKNLSAEDILLGNKYKENRINIKTVDKATNTRKFKFN